MVHDVRWNPELEEWFCALCGRTSDHVKETDAVAELGVFECLMVGTEVRKMTPLKRKTRARIKKTEV